MTVPEALDALRALDYLPTARRQFLARLIVDAPTVAQRDGILRTATNEAQRAQEATGAAYATEYEQRQFWANRNPPKRSSGIEAGRVGSGNYGEKISVPEVRPVVTSWTTPTKPDLKRPGRIPEQSEGQERTVRDRALRAEPEDSKHGLRGYNKLGCRCDVCKAAKSASRIPRGLRSPKGTIPEHGTTGRYTHHKCRCQDCRDAVARYAREHRARQMAAKDV